MTPLAVLVPSPFPTTSAAAADTCLPSRAIRISPTIDFALKIWHE